MGRERDEEKQNDTMPCGKTNVKTGCAKPVPKTGLSGWSEQLNRHCKGRRSPISNLREVSFEVDTSRPNMACNNPASAILPPSQSLRRKFFLNFSSWNKARRRQVLEKLLNSRNCPASRSQLTLEIRYAFILKRHGSSDSRAISYCQYLFPWRRWAAGR
jgi:hypothetical protein